MPPTSGRATGTTATRPTIIGTRRDREASRDRRPVLNLRNCPGERLLVLGNHQQHLLDVQPRAALLLLLPLGLAVTTCVFSYGRVRHYRDVFRMQGAIDGFVLQMINGVAKLRVANAESHALAHWASGFSEQKRASLRARRWAAAQHAVTGMSSRWPWAPSTKSSTTAARPAECRLGISANVNTDFGEREHRFRRT